MSRPPLHVASFGGGVLLAGSAEQRHIDELLAADSYEIGPRGALIAASDVTPYVTLNDNKVGTPLAVIRIHGLAAVSGFGQATVMGICEGLDGFAPVVYLVDSFVRQGAVSPIGIGSIVTNMAGADFVAIPSGILATTATFPGLFHYKAGAGPIVPINITLFCFGAREGFAPNVAPGLYVAISQPSAPGLAGLFPMGKFDALGTGAIGELNVLAPNTPGTKAQQLFARGVITYNNHAFCWGFDSADASHGDGPTRVMFSNLGNPLKWGNDNVDAAFIPPATPGVDRLFTDSDAIVLGDAGELVRGAIKIFGKLYFGTNRALHYIAGYGRDSFLTDGATPVMKAFNIVGPYAMIEGPDKLLYGVSDQGLWSFDGVGAPNPLFLKLVDFDQRSRGYWDLIWTDNTRVANNYPGMTNQDLVWMAIDWDRHQVLVGIPWCDATLGYGYGTDTVVVKYHTQTGGFTRQVFAGVQYTAVGYFRHESQQPETRFLGTATAGQTTVQRYGYKIAPADSVMPASLPVATVGPYAPYGPDGRGSLRRIYLTLAWAAAVSLPIVFQISTTWDQKTSDNYALTLGPSAPGAPLTNDLWLDTSGTDTNLGNGTAGVLTASFPAYLLKRWTGTAWQQLAGLGTNGTRATIRLPMDPRNGTRLTVTAQCTSAAGRFQLEGLGEKADGGSAAA